MTDRQQVFVGPFGNRFLAWLVSSKRFLTPAKRARLPEFIVELQNKMHGAKRGHTVADIMVERAKATVPLIGRKTTRPGGFIRQKRHAHRQFLLHFIR